MSYNNFGPGPVGGGYQQSSFNRDPYPRSQFQGRGSYRGLRTSNPGNVQTRNSQKVYVANIPRETHAKDLQHIFEQVGEVTLIEFKGDFAFIQFANSNGCSEAVRRFDQYEFLGKRLLVQPYCYRGGDLRYHDPRSLGMVQRTPMNETRFFQDRGGGGYSNRNMSYGRFSNYNPGQSRSNFGSSGGYSKPYYNNSSSFDNKHILDGNSISRGGHRMIINNLSSDTDRLDVKEFALKAGRNMFVIDIYERRGIKQALVSYSNRDDFEWAVKNLDQRTIKGNKVRCFDAKDDTPSPSRSRSHSRRRRRDRSRGRSRSRDRSQDRSRRHHSNDRERRRSKDRSSSQKRRRRSRSKSGSPSTKRDRAKYRSRSHDRSVSPTGKRRSKSKSKSHSRGRERGDRDRGRDRYREREKDREHHRGRDRDRDRDRPRKSRSSSSHRKRSKEKDDFETKIIKTPSRSRSNSNESDKEMKRKIKNDHDHDLDLGHRSNSEHSSRRDVRDQSIEHERERDVNRERERTGEKPDGHVRYHERDDGNEDSDVSDDLGRNHDGDSRKLKNTRSSSSENHYRSHDK